MASLHIGQVSHVVFRHNVNHQGQSLRTLSAQLLLLASVAMETSMFLGNSLLYVHVIGDIFLPSPIDFWLKLFLEKITIIDNDSQSLKT